MNPVSCALLMGSASYLLYVLFRANKLIQHLRRQNRELLEIATDQLHAIKEANMVIEELSNQQEI